MAASGAKYGISTSHFYWIGAIPAMVFLGVFMMPFYYGSRARSVPEYLRLRFDEKTRGFNAISFALMTVFSSGISMYAMAKLLQILHVFDAPFAALGLGPEYIFHVCVVVVGARRRWSTCLLGGLSSAIYNEVLQFFLIVAGFRAAGVSRPARRRRLVGHRARRCRARLDARVARVRQRRDQPDGGRCVRRRDGARLRAVVRLLVHRLPRGAARDGRRFDGRRAAHAADRRRSEDVVSVSGGDARPDRAVGARRSDAAQDARGHQRAGARRARQAAARLRPHDSDAACCATFRPACSASA